MCNSTAQLVTAIKTLLYMLSTKSLRWTIKIKLNWMTTIYQWSGLNVAVAAADCWGSGSGRAENKKSLIAVNEPATRLWGSLEGRKERPAFTTFWLIISYLSVSESAPLTASKAFIKRAQRVGNGEDKNSESLCAPNLHSHLFLWSPQLTICLKYIAAGKRILSFLKEGTSWP